LPPGFLAIDLAKDRGLKLFDPDRHRSPVSEGTVPRFDNGLIGDDPQFVDTAPASNADIAQTIISVLKLDAKDADKGKLVGRVLTEVLPGGVLPRVQKGSQASR
jgi:hypothetical protein